MNDWLAGLVGGWVLMAAVAAVNGRVIYDLGRSKRDQATLVIHKAAFESYPEWRADLPDGPPCPDSLARLAVPPHDPWRTPYRMTCDETAFVIVSAGDDRAFGTADDVRSDE